MQDAELTRKRFIELGKKSENAPYYIFTDFLGLMEQAIFHEAKKEFLGAKYTFFGGADGTERIMIRFGDKEELGYEEPFPIVTIKAEPLSIKFAENLTHRDYLGSILALGIERSTVGDIIIRDKTAYIFTKEDIADYITDSLTRVRRTDVRLSRVESVPEGELYRTERKTLQAVGERVDAVIAKLFGISREESLTLFKKGLVFANGRTIQSASYVPKQDELISVRGHGRFIYRGYETTTRKGKLNLQVDLYV